MSDCRTTRHILQSNEVRYEETMKHDTFLRDWRAHLLVEFSRNKFACEILDRLICDDRYKVENKIIFYKDEIDFVLESTLKERLIRTTHNKPTESFHLQPKNHTTVCIDQTANVDKGQDEEQVVMIDPSKRFKKRDIGHTNYKGHINEWEKRYAAAQPLLGVTAVTRKKGSKPWQ